jgi:hypothetical protein
LRTACRADFGRRGWSRRSATTKKYLIIAERNPRLPSVNTGEGALSAPDSAL